MPQNWDDAKRSIAAALAWVKARENAEQALGTTLEQSILEELVRLDSQQGDAVTGLGSGGLVAYQDDGSVRIGALQELDKLEAQFFGDDTTKGLLATLREMPDPNSTV